MQAFEQLLEAIEYSRDTDSIWYEQFSDMSEARDILNKAKHQLLDEYQVARLSIALGDEPPETLEEMEDTAKRCFLRLRRMLANNG